MAFLSLLRPCAPVMLRLHNSGCPRFHSALAAAAPKKSSLLGAVYLLFLAHRIPGRSVEEDWKAIEKGGQGNVLQKAQLEWEILLHQRKNSGFFDGHYSLVAGHMENGETIHAAAIREAQEEIGEWTKEPEEAGK